MTDIAYLPALVPYPHRLVGEQLLREAEAATGLEDWGGKRWDEERFRHDFALFCAAVEATAQISQQGRDRTHARVHTMLVSRLRYIAARNATFGVDRQTIVAPLIGTGMPRAGTTFFHGLLAQDPANRVVLAHEAAMPAAAEGNAKNRHEAETLYQRILDFQGISAPEITSIHPFGAGLPEECTFMQEGACTPLYTVYWDVPEFAAATGDKMPTAYAWQRGIMQYLQAIRPGGRWALKAPGHMFGWEELLFAFPDAHVYVNHRDPGKVIPSIASLYAAMRRLYSDRGVNEGEIGGQQLAAWQYAMNNLVDWRSNHAGERNIVDVHYSELIKQPIETVRQVYDAFGLPLSAVAVDRMKRHLETDDHGKGPKRRYTLSEYGLTEAMIDTAFERYFDYFGVQREPRDR